MLISILSLLLSEEKAGENWEPKIESSVVLDIVGSVRQEIICSFFSGWVSIFSLA
jgi:hypothetical protein